MINKKAGTVVSTLLLITLAVLVFVLPSDDLKWVLLVGAPLILLSSFIGGGGYDLKKAVLGCLVLAAVLASFVAPKNSALQFIGPLVLAVFVATAAMAKKQ